MKGKSVAKDFPIVCVGGSAGGLDAYTRLLRHLPADPATRVGHPVEGEVPLAPGFVQRPLHRTQRGVRHAREPDLPGVPVPGGHPVPAPGAPEGGRAAGGVGPCDAQRLTPSGR